MNDSAPTPSDASEKYKRQLKRAQEALAAGDAIRAERLFGELLGEPHIHDLEWCLGLSALCLRFGRAADAAEFAKWANKADAQNPRCMVALAEAYVVLERDRDAEMLLQGVLEKQKDFAPALALMGVICIHHRQYLLARDYLERAMGFLPEDAEIQSNLAKATSALGDYPQAMKHLEASVRLGRKRDFEYLYTLGMIHSEMGNYEDAMHAYRQSLARKPAAGAVYHRISTIKKFGSDDRQLIEQMKSGLEAGMSPVDRAAILYALGKAHDDLGQWDVAWQYFSQANLLAKPATRPRYAGAELFRASRRRFPAGTLPRSEPDAGSFSSVPVFIVGMPRSGTTLTERIIANHPLAAAAGELEDMNTIAAELLQIDAPFLQRWFYRKPPPQTLRACADRYLHKLREGREGAAKVTDKLPSNYLFLSMVASLFPRARVVHVVRHPLDVCLSCYFQFFDRLPWTNDLGWIGDVYRIYRSSVSYWEEHLPQGMMMSIQYESLVENPEIEARKLIQFCGLEWDPLCLEAAPRSGAIRTASLWQVRQPVYKTSKMRWVPYAKYLTGLASELHDFLTEEDLAIFAQQGLEVKKS